MSFGGQTPTIVVLREGTDQSQGRGQVISNINACLAVQATIKGTLGPYGGDLLMVDENGRQTITNDGATVMKLLDIVHPAARVLTDIARSQDAEVGDGTTSVVVLAGEILKEIKDFVEQGVSSQTIMKGLRRASHLAVNKIMEIAVDTAEGNQRDTLQKLAATAMSSKLIHRNADFFTKMVVDAVLSLDQDELNEKLIGVKKITGGALQDSLFVNGVAFKKTFSYAGFEQQPKTFKQPKIVCLNVELELKSEKDNAEVRVSRSQNTRRLSTRSGRSSTTRWKRYTRRGPRLCLASSLSVIWQHSTLQTATSSVLDVSPPTISTAYAEQQAQASSLPALTFRRSILVPASPLTSDRLVASASTSSRAVQRPRLALWCSVVVPSSSSPRSSEAYTTPL
ncbi:T-complex protein 1 subunit eta [Pyrenophora teres f. teres]|nr:T-complex protein 1 subunit eta [Pyrenophora teres f. teres]